MSGPGPPADVAIPGRDGRMPLIGFGTWRLRGSTAVQATTAALEAGYRLLDTATMYRNESEVGRALAESGLPATTSSSPPSVHPTASGGSSRRFARASTCWVSTTSTSGWCTGPRAVAT
jgi:2,5-diketo-D-gluconate reductase A